MCLPLMTVASQEMSIRREDTNSPWTLDFHNEYLSNDNLDKSQLESWYQAATQYVEG